MPGITMNSNVSQLEAHREMFRGYAAWNHREGAELFLGEMRKTATELYMQTAAVSPTPAEIAADVKKQGWKIPAWFRPGNDGKGFRWGRGKPANWISTSYQKVKQKARRGRPKKGAGAILNAGEDAYMAQKPTLQMMQEFVIKIRTAARLFLASGWLGAVADLGGSLKATSGKVDRSRGGATIRRGPGRIEVEFWNKTPGIEVVEARTQFVEKAIAVRIVDMAVYIDRKRREALQKAA